MGSKQQKSTPKSAWHTPMTSGLETERVYSGFGASKICHLLTYTFTHLVTAPGPTRGHCSLYTAQQCLPIIVKWQSRRPIRLYSGGGVHQKRQAAWAERQQRACSAVDCSAGSQCSSPTALRRLNVTSRAWRGGTRDECRDRRRGPAEQFTSATVTHQQTVRILSLCKREKFRQKYGKCSQNFTQQRRGRPFLKVTRQVMGPGRRKSPSGVHIQSRSGGLGVPFLPEADAFL